MKSGVPSIAKTLGRAGLLPFIAAPVAMLAFQDDHARLVGKLLADYALGIITFLLGIWWGMGLIRRHASALLMSNGIFITAVAGRWVLEDGAFLPYAAAILGITLLIERSHTLFKPQPAYYARMRVELTVVACAALLLCAWELTAGYQAP